LINVRPNFRQNFRSRTEEILTFIRVLWAYLIHVFTARLKTYEQAQLSYLTHVLTAHKKTTIYFPVLHVIMKISQGIRQRIWHSRPTVGQDIGQVFGQDVSQIVAQDVGRDFGPDFGQVFAQDLNRFFVQDCGQTEQLQQPHSLQPHSV